jgi:hypothetical protein
MNFLKGIIDKFKSLKFLFKKSTSSLPTPTFIDTEEDVIKISKELANIRNEFLPTIVESHIYRLIPEQEALVEKKTILLNLSHLVRDYEILKALNYKIELLNTNKELQVHKTFQIKSANQFAILQLSKDLVPESTTKDVTLRLAKIQEVKYITRFSESNTIKKIRDELLEYSLINLHKTREIERKEAERIQREKLSDEEFHFHLNKAKSYIEVNEFDLADNELDEAAQKRPERRKEVDFIRNSLFSKKEEFDLLKSKFGAIINKAETAFHENQLERAIKFYSNAKLLNYDNNLCDKRIIDANNKINRIQKLEDEKRRIEEKKVEEIKKLKEDAEEIISYFKQNGIHEFYHYTDSRNINSIIQNNGIFSINELIRRNIDYIKGSETGELPEYVRLSYTKNHPLMYKSVYKDRIINPKVLQIDLTVASFLETKFTNVNAARTATYPTVKFGDDLKFIKTYVKLNIVRQAYRSNLPEDEKPYYQAEVMIKTYLSSEYILNLITI